MICPFRRAATWIQSLTVGRRHMIRGCMCASGAQLTTKWQRDTDVTDTIRWLEDDRFPLITGGLENRARLYPAAQNQSLTRLIGAVVRVKVGSLVAFMHRFMHQIPGLILNIGSCVHVRSHPPPSV